MSAEPSIPNTLPRAAVVQLAKDLTSLALKVSNVGTLEAQPIPLRQIARSLGIHVEFDQLNKGPRSAGALWVEERAQQSLFGDFSADIKGSSNRSRFTLAHEIAHRLVELYYPKGATLGGERLEQVIDEIASHLLAPRSVLLAALGNPRQPVTLTLDQIIEIHAALRVSLSCLIKRFNDLNFDGDFDVQNWLFTASPNVSAKKRDSYAPRIQSICAPREMFIPVNKRIETLGMTSCLNIFRNAPLYTAGTLQDRFSYWRRSDWKRCEAEQLFSYMIYETVSGTRLMLAVALKQVA